MSIKFLPLLIIMTFVAETVFAVNIDGLIRENRLLESELKLAGKPDIYFIFNLTEKKVQFKAKGVVLKELPVENIKLWGLPVQPEPLKLIKKTTLLKPKRAKIRPTKINEDSFELEALELEDMPARYRLTMENDVWLYVRPEPDGILSKIFYGVSILKSYISRPVLSLWNTLWGRTFTEIDITVDEKDARALYWSFTEGLSCIIYGSVGDNRWVSRKPVDKRDNSHKNNKGK